MLTGDLIYPCSNHRLFNDNDNNYNNASGSTFYTRAPESTGIYTLRDLLNAFPTYDVALYMNRYEDELQYISGIVRSALEPRSISVQRAYYLERPCPPFRRLTNGDWPYELVLEADGRVHSYDSRELNLAKTYSEETYVGDRRISSSRSPDEYQSIVNGATPPCTPEDGLEFVDDNGHLSDLHDFAFDPDVSCLFPEELLLDL